MRARKNSSSNSACAVMGSELVIVTEERHLELIMDSWMKLWAHCSVAIKKGNWMLRIIKEGIESQTEIIVMPLYKCILDLHLEYCLQFFSPPPKWLWELWKRLREGERRIVRNSCWWIELQMIKYMCTVHSSKETCCGRGLSGLNPDGCGGSKGQGGRFFTTRMWLSCGTACHATVTFLQKISWKKNPLRSLRYWVVLVSA